MKAIDAKVNSPEHTLQKRQFVYVNDGGGITIICNDVHYNDYIPPDVALGFAILILEMHGVATDKIRLKDESFTDWARRAGLMREGS